MCIRMRGRTRARVAGGVGRSRDTSRFCAYQARIRGCNRETVTQHEALPAQRQVLVRFWPIPPRGTLTFDVCLLPSDLRACAPRMGSGALPISEANGMTPAASKLPTRRRPSPTRTEKHNTHELK
jgi:hypothetical protein